MPKIQFLECIRRFSAENPYFLDKSRLLLYEQLWRKKENWLVKLFWLTIQILEWSYTSLSIGWFMVMWAISEHCHLISTSSSNPANICDGTTASFNFPHNLCWMIFVNCPFLSMDFHCLNATEPIWGDSLLFATESPGVVLS